MKSLTRLERRRRRTLLYFYILLALLPLLVAASYTWLSIGTHLRVSDMSMYINSGTDIKLARAYDAPEEAWSQTLDFSEIVSADTVLSPATWSERNQSLYSARYGYDGRAIQNSYTRLTEQGNANRKDGYAYYVAGSFYMRASEDCTVSLSEGVAVNGGENGAGTYVIGTPLWDQSNISHRNGGSGAECAIRVRLEFTPVDQATGEAGGPSSSYIYEPNCDAHVDEAVVGYVDTPSIDGTATLINRDRLILQTLTGWSEASPVQERVTIKEFGSFTTDQTLISLSAGEVVRVKMTVWLEGMDVDCTNDIIDAKITMNIQFVSDLGAHGGLVQIPDATER